MRSHLIFLTVVSLCTSQFLFADAIKTQNTTACDILKRERREEIFNIAGLKKLDTVRKKFNSTITTKQKDQLSVAANVPAFDPFFASDSSKNADLKSMNDFKDACTGVLNKMGTSIDGHKYKRTDGVYNEQPYARLVEETTNYRDTLLCQKPSLQLARNFNEAKSVRLNYLNQFIGPLVFVIEQSYRTDSTSKTPASAGIKVYANSGNGEQQLTFNDFVELTLPTNCKNKSHIDDEIFDLVEQNISVDNGSRTEKNASSINDSSNIIKEKTDQASKQ